MIFTRALPFSLPIVLLGVGFLICKAIFSAFPLKKESLKNEEAGSALYLLWGLAFLIITGQLFFIVRVFTILFKCPGNLVLPFFAITFLFISFYVIFFFRKS